MHETVLKLYLVWAFVLYFFIASTKSIFVLTRNFIAMQTFKGRVTGVKVKAVDTTGAGDSFVGGFLYQLAAEMTLHEVIYC